MFSKIKQHYHWIIAVVMLLQLAVVGGLANNYTGLFILPITGELGISRASFSLAFTLKHLMSFATTLFSGSLFLRYGNKKPMVAGLLLNGLGYAILPLSSNVGMLALGNVFLGISEGLCCTAAVSRIISTWFVKYQGLVWGTVSASTGIGGSLICVMLSGIIQTRGWRIAYFTSSGIILVMLVLVFLVVKSHPEQMKLRPYGIGQAHKSKKPSKKDDRWPGYEADQLRKTPVFYIALAGVFMVSLALYLAFDSLVPHLQAQGLTENEAVAQQSAMLIYLTLSKFLAGLLSDWIGAKRVAIICSGLSAVSLFLLSTVAPGLSATAAVFLYAFSLPITTVMVPLVAVSVLGYRAQHSYHGIFMSAPLLGLLIASPVASAVFDQTGSYVPILAVSSVLAGVGTVLFVVLFFLTKARKAKEKTVTVSSE